MFFTFPIHLIPLQTPRLAYHSLAYSGNKTFNSKYRGYDALERVRVDFHSGSSSLYAILADLFCSVQISGSPRWQVAQEPHP